MLDHHEAAAAVRLPLAPQPTDSKFNSHVKPSPSSINLILTCTLRHLLFAYMQLWSHDVDPPESREFCSLMLLSFMLCGPHPDVQSYNACFYSLPQCVRSSPQVLHTAAIAQCFLSDTTVRLFERLGDAPYLVVVLLTSRLGDLRCRCVKHLASAKLKLPFDVVVRCMTAPSECPHRDMC